MTPSRYVQAGRLTTGATFHAFGNTVTVTKVASHKQGVRVHVQHTNGAHDSYVYHRNDLVTLQGN